MAALAFLALTRAAEHDAHIVAVPSKGAPVPAIQGCSTSGRRRRREGRSQRRLRMIHGRRGRPFQLGRRHFRTRRCRACAAGHGRIHRHIARILRPRQRPARTPSHRTRRTWREQWFLRDIHPRCTPAGTHRGPPERIPATTHRSGQPPSLRCRPVNAACAALGRKVSRLRCGAMASRLPPEFLGRLLATVAVVASDGQDRHGDLGRRAV